MRARCGAWRTRIGGARAARSRITSAGRARLAPLRAAAGSDAASDEGLVTEFLAQSGDFVVFVVDGTKVCNRAALVHTTSPTATHALGRVLMGTTLIGASKGSQVQVTFKGNGALGQIMAISEGEYIKARLDNPIIENDVESIVATGARVGHAVGKQGVLTVVRKNTVSPHPLSPARTARQVDRRCSSSDSHLSLSLSLSLSSPPCPLARLGAWPVHGAAVHGDHGAGERGGR